MRACGDWRIPEAVSIQRELPILVVWKLITTDVGASVPPLQPVE